MKWFRILALAWAVSGTLGLQAQDVPAGADLRSDIDTTLITLGDPIRLSLWVDHGPEVQIMWPEDPGLAPFELLALEVSEPVAAGSGFRSAATYIITAFELGDLEIPSVGVDVLVDGVAAEGVTSDRFGIEVVSVGGDDAESLRDIKGPRALVKDWTVTVLSGLSLLLVVVVALILLRRWLAARRNLDETVLVPHRPIHELALEALDALGESDLLRRGEVKEYYVRLSEIIRSYLEGQFEIPALETTTLEVVHALRMTYLERDVVAEFGELLAASDLVKFAKHRPVDSVGGDVLQIAKRLVEKTWTPPEESTKGADSSDSEPIPLDGADEADGQSVPINENPAVVGVPAGKEESAADSEGRSS